MHYNKYIALFAALIVATTSFTGCLSGNEVEDESAGLAYVTGATLGSLYRLLPYQQPDGTDSIVKQSVSGSLYPLSIDQLNHRIYNTDSLPTHTDLSKVVFSQFNVKGTVTLKSLTSEKDTTFNMKDSTDMRQPREITVHSLDGNSQVTYTIELRKHQEEGDTLRWHLKTVSGLPSLTERRLFVHGDSLIVWGKQDGQAVGFWTMRSAPAEWHALTGSGIPEPLSIVQRGASFYGLTATGIVSTTDGSLWRETAPRPAGLTMLVGATTRSLYATSADSFMRSTDEGVTWTKENTPSAAAIPLTGLTAVSRPTAANASVEEILLVGQAADGTTTVWKRNEMREAELEDVATFEWSQIQDKRNNPYAVPNLTNTSLAFYDGGVILTGIKEQGKAGLYHCIDMGRTWNPYTLTLPALDSPEDIVMTTDSDNFIWVLSGTTPQLWQGRLNRLGWK